MRNALFVAIGMLFLVSCGNYSNFNKRKFTNGRFGHKTTRLKEQGALSQVQREQNLETISPDGGDVVEVIGYVTDELPEMEVVKIEKEISSRGHDDWKRENEKKESVGKMVPEKIETQRQKILELVGVRQLEKEKK